MEVNAEANGKINFYCRFIDTRYLYRGLRIEPFTVIAEGKYVVWSSPKCLCLVAHLLTT